MSTSLVPANIKIPAHLANRLGAPSALSDSISAGLSSGGGYPRISLKGARFRIIEGGTETVMPETSLKVIIVGANPAVTKTWYEKQWKPGDEPTAPDCQSLDGIRPNADSPKPQSDSCASCKHAQWGSKIGDNGQKMKACTDQKRLAVVAYDDPTGPIYLLNVTPAALKGLNQYHKELKHHGIPPEVVCTKLSFDTEASFPKLDFSFHSILDENTQAAVDSVFGTPQVMEVTGEVVQSATTVEIAKPMLVSDEKPKPVEIVVEEPKPEPTQPKRGFGAKAAAEPPKEEPKRGFTRKEPAAAPEAGNDLTTDIANLLAGMNADDATE